MNLNQRSKLALGIATLMEVAFPLMIGLLYMLMFLLMPIMIETNDNSKDLIFGIFFIGMLLFPIVIIFFAIFQIVIKVLYLIIVIQNKQSSDLIKILFVIGTFYFPYIGLPLYYILFILKENREGEGIKKEDEAILPA